MKKTKIIGIVIKLVFVAACVWAVLLARGLNNQIIDQNRLLREQNALLMKAILIAGNDTTCTEADDTEQESYESLGASVKF